MKLRSILMIISAMFLGSSTLSATEWTTALQPGNAVCVVDINIKDDYYWKLYQRYTDPKTDTPRIKLRRSAKKAKYLLLNPGLQSQPPHRIQDGWWKATLLPVKSNMSQIPSFTPVTFHYVRLKPCGWIRLKNKR